jgi:hypothetical protein
VCDADVESDNDTGNDEGLERRLAMSGGESDCDGKVGEDVL